MAVLKNTCGYLKKVNTSTHNIIHVIATVSKVGIGDEYSIQLIGGAHAQISDETYTPQGITTLNRQKNTYG